MLALHDFDWPFNVIPSHDQFLNSVIVLSFLFKFFLNFRITGKRSSHFCSQYNLWALTLDLKFAPLIALVKRYVFTELEVSTVLAYYFDKNLRHGTNRQALNKINSLLFYGYSLLFCITVDNKTLFPIVKSGVEPRSVPNDLLLASRPPA